MLARYDRITAQRVVQPAAADGTRDALAVLDGVLNRDGHQRSATQTRQLALAHADHLAILHAIWTDQITPARDRRYRDLLLACLPPEHRREPGHQARWLWRTMRAAELAGLDIDDVLTTIIGERDLAGARRTWPPSSTPASVTGPAHSSQLPLGHGRPEVPAIADAERLAYLAQIAALMDARKDRIGEHAAQHALPWAVSAPGPVPAELRNRADWQRRAAAIGAWRELSGHRDPTEPIGPEPVAAAPDLRAAWHEALAALGPADGSDVRGMPDGRLLHLRDTYSIETAWAPRYVGDQLRQVRAAARDARLTGLRAAAEAAAAAQRGDHDTGTRQHELAATTTPCTRSTGSGRPSSPRP